MIRIDARGLRGQDVFLRIRETVSQFCGRAFEAEILSDDPQAIPKIKAFSAMSGCTTEIRQDPDYWTIHVQGDACTCR